MSPVSLTGADIVSDVRSNPSHFPDFRGLALTSDSLVAAQLSTCVTILLYFRQLLHLSMRCITLVLVAVGGRLGGERPSRTSQGRTQ